MCVQPVAQAADNVGAVQRQLGEQGVERRRLAGRVYLKLVGHGAELVLEVLGDAALGAGFPRPGDGVHVTVEVVQGGQGFVERGNGALGAADFAAEQSVQPQQARIDAAGQGLALIGGGGAVAENAGDFVGQRLVGGRLAGVRLGGRPVEPGFAGDGLEQRPQGRGRAG